MKDIGEVNEIRFPAPILDAIKLIPEEMFSLSFEEVEKKSNPDIDLRRMRVAFWMEHDRSFRTGTYFNLNNVYRGIMTAAMFKKYILSNSYRTLYLTIAPPSYQVIMEEMLHYSLMLEREILEMSHIGEDGIDVDLLRLKQKVAQGVHDRVKGLPISRSLIASMNENEKPNRPSDLKDIDQEIKKLRAELGDDK